MVDSSLEEYDDVIMGAGESLVASIVMLVAGIFSFLLSAVVIQMVGGIGRFALTGNFVVLSASIMTAAILVASTAVIRDN